MKTLSETWFAEGRIDFELKKYTLLAWLQEVNRYFDENKLYPQLSDLVFHFNNLIAFRQNKKFAENSFPKRLTGIQLERLQFVYERMVEDDEMMKELEDIIHFAAGKMKGTLDNGTEIYELVEERLQIVPVGLIPLDNREGYFFLRAGSDRTGVYQYRLSFFEKHDEKYRSLKTSFIDYRYRSLSTTYENIKSELIRFRKDLPNPAVYAIESPLAFPIDETLLPIAKRSLVKFLDAA